MVLRSDAKLCASIAQLAECVLGKDEVTGSTPVGSSKKCVMSESK